jgi:hypothetical protein
MKDTGMLMIMMGKALIAKIGKQRPKINIQFIQSNFFYLYQNFSFQLCGCIETTQIFAKTTKICVISTQFFNTSTQKRISVANFKI